MHTRTTRQAGDHLHRRRGHARRLSLAAGVSLFSLSRRMGTSVEMIDRTHGHLAPDAEEYERGLLDAWDKSYAAAAAERR